MAVETERRTCDACQLVRINGVVCHETGCPEAWRDKRPPCKWCCFTFQPRHPRQTTCSASCYRAYYG